MACDTRIIKFYFLQVPEHTQCCKFSVEINADSLNKSSFPLHVIGNMAYTPGNILRILFASFAFLPSRLKYQRLSTLFVKFCILWLKLQSQANLPRWILIKKSEIYFCVNTHSTKLTIILTTPYRFLPFCHSFPFQTILHNFWIIYKTEFVKIIPS